MISVPKAKLKKIHNVINITKRIDISFFIATFVMSELLFLVSFAAPS